MSKESVAPVWANAVSRFGAHRERHRVIIAKSSRASNDDNSDM
jgi:hypothetical protein